MPEADIEMLTIVNAKREIALGRELGVSPGPSRADYVRRMCADLRS